MCCAICPWTATALASSAAPVKARNLGILASSDILAVEQASIDMVYKLPEAELHDLKERIESRQGLRQLLVHERDEDGQ